MTDGRDVRDSDDLRDSATAAAIVGAPPLRSSPTRPATREDIRELEARFDARFQAVSARFVRVDNRFVGIDARLDDIDRRQVTMAQRMDTRFQVIDARIETHSARIDDLRTRVSTIERQVDQLATKVDRLGRVVMVGLMGTALITACPVVAVIIALAR